MSTEINNKKNKGGRPLKAVKMDQQLAVMCTVDERKIIEAKASTANVSVSELLRTVALQGQVDRKIKIFPKEVLLFTATLNHLAANINQIAKKRNQNDELNDTERAGLNSLTEQVKNLAAEIKNYLQ
jgi:peptidoglycan hydrolase CwlO-like protein